MYLYFTTTSQDDMNLRGGYKCKGT